MCVNATSCYVLTGCNYRYCYNTVSITVAKYSHAATAVVFILLSLCVNAVISVRKCCCHLFTNNGGNSDISLCNCSEAVGGLNLGWGAYNVRFISNFPSCSCPVKTIAHASLF